MLGRLHVVLIHLPLGLLAGVVLLRLLSAWYGERYRSALPALMWLCAIGGLAAAAAGWILFIGEGNQWGALGSWHQWLGTALALVLIATAWAMHCVFTAGSWTSSIAADIGLVCCAVLAAITGHYGGQMTHGRNYLFGGSSSSLAATADPSPSPSTNAPAVAPIVIHSDTDAAEQESHDDNDQAEDTAEVDYQALWRAAEKVIINHCEECHNSDRARGYLNLERYDLIMRGGSSGPAVRPGEPQRSPLLTLAELPEDNWDRMPPDGPPLKENELDALRQWIIHGAPGPENGDNDDTDNATQNDDEPDNNEP
ncbi:MAG: hypothetical protein EA401_00345 [Planctomycetota bacterium]|nr:MAG: hypothetical protein EA401_00345 [Planctomycetota bacterium]